MTLLVLLGAAWASSTGPAMPAPGAANLPDTAFSSGRAMTNLVEIARRPHPTGSPEHARVRELVTTRLRELGLDPSIQTATSVIRRGDLGRAATVRNIVARIPGTASTGAILVTAHYDAVPLSSGAGDDGVGIVTILETLRALRASEPLRNDLIVVVTDAEELGLLGMRAFVDEHPWMADVRVALSVEMRGGGGPSIMFETAPDNGWIVEALDAGDPRPFANSLALAIYRRMPNDTDFTPLREAGVQGLNFAAIGRAEIYHQATDVASNVEEATIQHHGLHLLGVVRELGGRDLAEVDGPDRVYFRLPFLGLITYPVSWVHLISGVLLLLAALALLLARARGHGLGGVGGGLLLGLVAVGLTAAVGWGVRSWVFGAHADQGTLLHARYSTGYAVALAAFSLGLVAALYGIARRRLTPAQLALGAALLGTIAAVSVGFVVPLGAMNLQIPAGAALLAAGVLASGRSDVRPGMARWVASLVLALPVLALLVPMTELVQEAMSFALAPVLGGVMGLTVLLLLPTLEWLGDPNRFWAPLGAFAVGGLLAGVGVAGAEASPEAPAPSTLVWVNDRVEGAALWLSAEGPGLEWATEQAGAFDETRSMGELGLAGEYRVRPGPPVQGPRPTLAVRSDTVVSGERRVELALTFPLEPELVRLSLPPEGGGSIVAVGGRPIPEGGVRRVDHWGRPVNDTLRLTIGLSATSPLPALDVVEHHLRPAELLGEAPFERPAHLTPDPDRSSDRAVVRTRLGTSPPDSVGGAPGPETVRTDSVAPPVPDSGTATLRPDTSAADTSGGPGGPG